MATINVGGSTVEVPDNLDLPQRQTARTSGPAVTRPAPGPQPVWRPTNPNVMRGVPSAEARAWEAGPAPAPAAAPAAPGRLRQAWNAFTAPPTAAAPAATATGRAGQAALRGAGALSRVGGAVVGAGYEAKNTLDVAKDPNATKIDVATQAAEGATKLATAGLGAKAGALGGAALGSVVPGIGNVVGGALGGLAGGAAGYFGGEAAIKGLRNMVGVDEASPIERVRSDAAPNAQTPAPNAQTPAAAAPAGPQQPAATPAAQPPALPGLPSVSATAGPGDITRSVGPDGRVTYSGGGNVDPNARIYDAGGLRQQANLSILPGGGSGGGGMRSPVGDTVTFAPTAAPRVRHSGNDWEARNNLRNLAVSANSITNNGGAWDQRRRGDISPARQAYAAALENDLKLQGLDPTLATEMAKSDNTLRGQTIESNNRLRGDVYSADQRLRGQIYDADATAATARAKAAGEAAGKQNDLDIENAKRAQEQVTIYGADGSTPDMAATQRAVLAIDKILPGYSTMSEQARKEHSGDASAIANIFNRTRGQSELGVGQAIFGNTNPELDSMPNFQGGKLKRSGLLGGLPGGAGVDGYYMEMPDGREIALGKGLSERELQMLRHNAATGQWIPEKKKD